MKRLCTGCSLAVVLLLCGCGDEERPAYNTVDQWVKEAASVDDQSAFDRKAKDDISPKDADREYEKLRAEILGE